MNKPTIEHVERVRRLRNKIALAFRDLRKQGLFARMNFACCMNCALAAIPDGKSAVYYHHQDHEHMLEAGWVNIRYATPGDKSMADLARTAVATLEQHGLTVKWNGCTSRTLEVSF